VAAYFPKDKVEIVSRQSKIFSRRGKSGGTVDIHFCPTCGSSLISEASVFPNIRAVMVGCFLLTPRLLPQNWLDGIQGITHG
jgi:hypothetical protein